MKRYSLRSALERELKELKYLEKWFFVMSGFSSSRWMNNPANRMKIERLKELRKRHLLDILGVRKPWIKHS